MGLQYYRTLSEFHPSILAELEDYISAGCSLDIIVGAYERALTGVVKDLAINTAIWLKGIKS